MKNVRVTVESVNPNTGETSVRTFSTDSLMMLSYDSTDVVTDGVLRVKEVEGKKAVDFHQIGSFSPKKMVQFQLSLEQALERQEGYKEAFIAYKMLELLTKGDGLSEVINDLSKKCEECSDETCDLAGKKGVENEAKESCKNPFAGMFDNPLNPFTK